MVGHLHLQAMDDSLKGKNREGLLDSPDSGLPPSPSPPFCSLSPGLIESRSGSCTTPVESHHGYYKKESREGKLVRNISLHLLYDLKQFGNVKAVRRVCFVSRITEQSVASLTR